MNLLSFPSRRLAVRSWLALLLAALWCGAPMVSRGQSSASREYQIEAVFLLNFLNFVEWPPGTFPSADAPVRIAVLGDDPFGPALDEVVAGETVRNRSVVVVRAGRAEQVRDCQLVFVSASERGRLGRIFAVLGNAPILTVSDIPDFARRGGVIAFYTEGNKVRFEIDPSAAARHGLKLRAQLLSLARIVGAP